MHGLLEAVQNIEFCSHSALAFRALLEGHDRSPRRDQHADVQIGTRSMAGSLMHTSCQGPLLEGPRRQMTLPTVVGMPPNDSLAAHGVETLIRAKEEPVKVMCRGQAVLVTGEHALAIEPPPAHWQMWALALR